MKAEFSFDKQNLSNTIFCVQIAIPSLTVPRSDLSEGDSVFCVTHTHGE